MLLYMYSKALTGQDFKRTPAFPLLLWLQCVWSTWATPEVQMRLNIQQGRKTFPPPPYSLPSFTKLPKGLFLFLGVYQNWGRSGCWYLTASKKHAKNDAELTIASTARLQKKHLECSSAALSGFVPSDMRHLSELSPSCPATTGGHRQDLPESSSILCGLLHALKDPSFWSCSGCICLWE